MKQYDSVPKWRDDDLGKPVIAFDKLDGSNIRAEWNTKQGFYKFGTRHHLLDEKEKPFGEAIDLIRTKYADDLSLVCKEQKWKNVVFFFEFYGPNSFAGWHPEEVHTVTLIDANVYKVGLLPARQFVRMFGFVDIPKIVYEGELTKEVVESVRNGTLDGVTLEGVVCKAPSDAGTMFKIKSQAWLDRLRERCGDDENLFKRLS